MDKIKLDAFVAPQNEEVYRDIAGTTISIRRIAPYMEVMESIQWAVNQLIDDRPYASTPIQQIITEIAVIKTFTNIDLSMIDELSNPEQLYAAYDVITGVNILGEITPFIDATQIKFLVHGINGAVKNILTYRNSAAGIIASMADSSDIANEKVQEMFKMLQDPNQFAEAKHFAKVYEDMTTPRKE